MPAIVLQRPTAAEHAEYYRGYIDLVPTGDLFAIMGEQESALRSLAKSLSHEQSARSYAPGKWTIREVVGHLIDTERVFSYRATAFSRGDTAPLPSFDQAVWLPMGYYNARPLGDIVDEWAAAREATRALLRYMPEEALSRRGSASGALISVLACLTVLPGHVIYHLNHIEAVYLPAVQ